MPQKEGVFGAGVAVDGGGEHIAALIKHGLRAVAVVVVHIEHGHARQAAIAQGLGGHRRVVDEAIPAHEVGPRVVPRWSRQRQSGPLATQDRLRRRQRTGRAFAGCGPTARHQGRARIKRVLPQPCGEVQRGYVGAKAVARRQWPDRGQGVHRRVGRVKRHPVVPGVGQKIQVIRVVHPAQGRVQRQVGRRGQHGAHRSTRQFVQHVLQSLRHFVAIDHAAAEHFLAAAVFGVAGVVKDEHG